MIIQVDTHTHTVLSGHAHSTLIENAQAASNRGLYGFVHTDHGPSIPGTSPEFNIGTYPFLPNKIEGVRIYLGIEANIIDCVGNIDISDEYLNLLDFVIAGMHENVLPPAGKKLDTKAAIAALENEHVDVLAHPDNPSYSLDYEAVVKAAAQHGKLLEVNNHSFEYRKGGISNAQLYLKLCIKHNVRVAVASDAHFATSVGQFDVSLQLLKEIGFPEELVINTTFERFEAYITQRKSF